MQEQKNELRGDSRTASLDSGTLSRKVSSYERLFLLPVKTAALHGKAIYVRPEFHQRIQRIVGSLTTTRSRCTAIWIGYWNTTSQPSTRKSRPGAAAGSSLCPVILKRHCHGNSQCRIPNLRADARTIRGVRPTDGRALPCASHRRAGAVAGQPAGLPAAEYLQTDVADPSRQRVALLHADQPQDLLPGRRCAVVPCGAGGTAQARPEAQKQGINSGSRIVTLVAVSGRISHQTDGKWAMNGLRSMTSGSARTSRHWSVFPGRWRPYFRSASLRWMVRASIRTRSFRSG